MAKLVRLVLRSTRRTHCEFRRETQVADHDKLASEGGNQRGGAHDSEVAGPDTQRCSRALRAVLHALRDRSTVDQATHPASQLPVLIPSLHYEGYLPAGNPEPLRSQAEFLEHASRWAGIMRRHWRPSCGMCRISRAPEALG
ncbi:DUF2267 domain-containing protein [Microvirga mediterraneensis]|uniref:DUF2267 domain-containing protein n=1 Tax=Microvirga mediterraneensis TaxID=2754695 RepID=A0A838BWR3_9HYPH|nr:DUF2267 domain-containing protein [Microvirga mediterraneensis]